MKFHKWFVQNSNVKIKSFAKFQKCWQKTKQPSKNKYPYKNTFCYTYITEKCFIFADFRVKFLAFSATRIVCFTQPSCMGELTKTRNIVTQFWQIFLIRISPSACDVKYFPCSRVSSTISRKSLSICFLFVDAFKFSSFFFLFTCQEGMVYQTDTRSKKIFDRCISKNQQIFFAHYSRHLNRNHSKIKRVNLLKKSRFSWKGEALEMNRHKYNLTL